MIRETSQKDRSKYIGFIYGLPMLIHVLTIHAESQIYALGCLIFGVLMFGRIGGLAYRRAYIREAYIRGAYIQDFTDLQYLKLEVKISAGFV